MQFSDVIGQERLKEQFLSSIRNQRPHHTQLLLGKSGQSSLPLALAFSQYLNCEQPNETDSCGICSSCLKNKKMIHPDVHFSFPTIKPSNFGTKIPTSSDFIHDFRKHILENPYSTEIEWIQQIEQGNKQSNITALECKEIIQRLKFTSSESKYKITIIWKPERLGKESNRLLKILEEPPQNTIFFLVAEEEDLILNTILSRSQILRTEPTKSQELISYLCQKFALDQEQAQHISLVSQNNIDQAIALADGREDTDPELLIQWFQTIAKNKSGLVYQVEKIADLSKSNLKNLLIHATEICHESLILQETDLNSPLPEAELKLAKWLGNKLSVEDSIQLMKILEDTAYAVERNANVKLLLLSVSLQIDELIFQRERV